MEAKCVICGSTENVLEILPTESGRRFGQYICKKCISMYTSGELTIE
jgi:hypothetical protein